MNKLSTPVMKRLYPRRYLQKLVAPTEIRFSSMILGLRTNSATWLYRFCIKNSVIDAWYLVSLVAHLNWPGLLENFLASCSIWQFQVKLSMNTLELNWTIKTSHRRIASKLKRHLFISCFNRSKDREQILIIEVE